jgi:hypothetical protein
LEEYPSSAKGGIFLAVLKSINAANSTLPAPEARLHVDEWNEDGRPPYWRCCDSEKY